MAIVSPSILSADFGKLGADCRTVLDAGAQMLHYDVMDGHFVPNISFGVPVLKSLHKTLPDAFYDVHLMISHPLQYAEPFIKAGATLYNFHLECEDDIQQTLDAVKALGCKTGLTIKPGTAPEALAPYLDQLDLDEALIREQEQQLQKTGKYYKHICWMAVPPLCMACYLYGLRPLLLCGIAMLTGNLCDRLVSLLRHRVYQNSDLSNESFGLVIALLMPVTVDIYVLVAAVLAGVLIGKEVFGGYGSYPFNPAAVGYAVAAVSWPEQVFRYPQPYTAIPLWDASSVPVSSAIEDTLSSGGMLNYSSIALSLGEYAAPMGTGAALVLLACGLFLWSQKDAHMTASVSFLATCALIAFFFPRQAGLAESDVLVNALPRLQCVRDELLTGAVLFSAVFLINEPYTCAHHRMGRILYGVLVGVVSMGFRYYGVYETGVCFAVLAVNSISAWIDRTEVRLYRLLHLPASGAGKEAAE